jgi:hypothetical protein
METAKPHSLSPHLRVSASPRLRVSASPRLPVPLSLLLLVSLNALMADPPPIDHHQRLWDGAGAVFEARPRLVAGDWVRLVQAERAL